MGNKRALSIDVKLYQQLTLFDQLARLVRCNLHSDIPDLSQLDDYVNAQMNNDTTKGWCLMRAGFRPEVVILTQVPHGGPASGNFAAAMVLLPRFGWRSSDHNSQSFRLRTLEERGSSRFLAPPSRRQQCPLLPFPSVTAIVCDRSASVFRLQPASPIHGVMEIHNEPR